MVARLAETLNEAGGREEAVERLRGPIDRIVLSPAETDMRAEFYGDLAGIPGLCEAAEGKDRLPETGAPGSQLSLVAGARKQLNLLFNAPGLRD